MKHYILENMQKTTRTLGIILAGGQGSRMGGKKHMKMLGKENLLHHMIKKVSPQVDDYVISGLNGLSDPDGYPHQTPLLGVLAGLGHAKKNGFSHVMVTPVDTPFIPNNLLQQWQKIGDFVYSDHLLFYAPVIIKDSLDNFLKSGHVRVKDWLQMANAKAMALPPRNLVNINTPEDLENAHKTL